MAYWNYRLLAHEENYELHFVIHEVFYTDDGGLDGYTDSGVDVHSETVDGIKQTLKLMEECLEKPILWYGEKWPREYNT